MKLLLSDGCLYHFNISDIFDIASKTKFDGIEIIWGNRLATNNTIEYIKDLIQEYSLPVMVIHEPFSSWSIPNWPDEPKNRIKYTIETAEQLNAEKIVVHCALNNDYIKWQKENIPILQRNNDIKIAVENMPEEVLLFSGFLHKYLKKLKKSSFKVYQGSISTKTKKILNCIDKHNYSLNNINALSKFPYLTMDTTHLGTKNENIINYYNKLSNKIIHIHFSDFDGNEHKMPNFGRLPLKELLKTLAKSNYKETISLEVNPKAFCNSTNKFAIIDELSETVEFIRSSFN